VKISISSSAVNDLECIQKYYEEEEVCRVGDRYIVSMIAHNQTLKGNPDIGRVVPEFGAAKGCLSYRSLEFNEYFKVSTIKE